MASDEGGERRRGQMRRRILEELCGRRRTAGELAGDLGISGTAVRDHLARLMEEGLVEYGVERRGPGKPKHVYRLTREGERMVSRGYLPILAALLSAVEARSDSAELESVLREAGRRLAAVERAGAAEGTDAATAAMEDLGGTVEVLRLEDGGYSVRGKCCPVSALSPEAPALCKLLEIMLAELTELEVREHCDREAPPHCRFDVRPRSA